MFSVGQNFWGQSKDRIAFSAIFACQTGFFKFEEQCFRFCSLDFELKTLISKEDYSGSTSFVLPISLNIGIVNRVIRVICVEPITNQIM